MEVDRVWNILWPATIAGETAVQKCPGGIESIGICIAETYITEITYNYVKCIMDRLCYKGLWPGSNVE